jgi:uncharacterized lipoprotein YbaY/heat shock protein HslJ/uncharacterized lipoprotein NlpE involved in copper resistance
MKLKSILFKILAPFFVMFSIIGCTTQGETTSESVTVSGTAAYRQRIAMPPNAVLNVRVEDVSRTDTAATLLAETSEAFDDRQVPIAFQLKVPNASINPDSSYNLRANISVDRQLRFTTTRSYPILTRGAGNKLDLLLDAMQPSSTGKSGVSITSASGTSVNFELPATFSGITPCADCPGIEQTLTLRSDGLYLLRRIYQERQVDPFVEHGRWTAEGNRLSLNSDSETQLFEIADDKTLRQLDREGQQIESSANLDLRRAAQVDPISESSQWQGEFRYMADTATFTDCASGVRWPVAMTKDYLAAERSYLKSRNVPGTPLFVNFKGRLEQRPAMEGTTIEQMVIEKYGSPHPGTTCASLASGKHSAIAELTDTYWKLVQLNGKKIPIAPSHKRQIRITLASEGSLLIGFSGCNQFSGTFKQTENKLSFSQMAGTMMACVAPYMKLEQMVFKMLDETFSYRIEGEKLFLLKADQIIACFEAVYLS